MFASNEFFGLEWDKPLNRKEETLSTPILHSYGASCNSFCALMQVFIQDARFSQECWRCRSTGTWHCVLDCFTLKMKAHDPPTCSMTLSQPPRSSVLLNNTVTAPKILCLAQWQCHSPQDPLSRSMTQCHSPQDPLSCSMTLSQPPRSSVSLNDTVSQPTRLISSVIYHFPCSDEITAIHRCLYANSSVIQWTCHITNFIVF